jgi:hypothetical protein
MNPRRTTTSASVSNSMAGDDQLQEIEPEVLAHSPYCSARGQQLLVENIQSPPTNKCWLPDQCSFVIIGVAISVQLNEDESGISCWVVTNVSKSHFNLQTAALKLHWIRNRIIFEL